MTGRISSSPQKRMWLSPTGDEELLKSLSLALNEFCEMRDGSVHLLLSKTVLKHQQQIVHTFEAICHKISLDGGRPNMCSWSHRRSVNLDQILTWEWTRDIWRFIWKRATVLSQKISVWSSSHSWKRTTVFWAATCLNQPSASVSAKSIWICVY